VGDTETTTAAEFSLSQGQLDDLALLLAKCLGRGNLTWLANSALGPQAVQQAGNDVDDINVFAASVVRALHEAGRIPKALELLRREGHRNGLLTLGVKHILSGNRLDDDAALQAFINEYEPFLGSAAMMDLLPKVGRTVCAVALGDPENRIIGSGFLIAPDVVITNFHVMESFLDVDEETGEVRPGGPGDQIFFFFDYMFAPPPNVKNRGKGHTSVCVSARKEDWLLKARVKLKGDGMAESPATVINEYDYAVIRLERPVGKQPSRRSGGAIRGWLQPEESIDVLTAHKRLLVFQHPQALAQQFDVGDYVQLDPSSSRVWYTVSTAHGSSGGAAVDTDGRLFALHNAEVNAVVPAALGRRVNQGIRIDLITKDLAAIVNREDVPADDGTLFWSLNDDLTDPHPIIGRAAFKGLVTQMRAPDAERVLVVTGPPQSGLQFSIKLLRRTLGRNVPVAIFTPKQLQELTPKVFLRALVENLGIIGTSGRPFPELPTTENVPGWLRKDLPQWLLESLSKDEELNPTKYPAWVVINTVVPKDESFLWADHLRDLIAALVGVHDSDNPGVDLPQLRWLFLAKEPDAETNPVALPVGGVRQLAEDLGAQTAYVADHTECLQNAWRSNNKEAALSDDVTAVFKTLGQMTLNMNANLPSDRRLPPRKVLAEHVRELIKTQLLMGGGEQ
jgi:hypothetical protein